MFPGWACQLEGVDTRSNLLPFPSPQNSPASHSCSVKEAQDVLSSQLNPPTPPHQPPTDPRGRLGGPEDLNVSINNWKSMKNSVTASSERGCGGNRARAQGKGERYSLRESDTPRQQRRETELERNSKSKIHLPHSATRQLMAS